MQYSSGDGPTERDDHSFTRPKQHIPFIFDDLKHDLPASGGLLVECGLNFLQGKTAGAQKNGTAAAFGDVEYFEFVVMGCSHIDFLWD